MMEFHIRNLSQCFLQEYQSFGAAAVSHVVVAGVVVDHYLERLEIVVS